MSKDGFKVDPRWLSGLQHMLEPETTGELAEFIYCAQWIRNFLPNFTKFSQLLIDIPEAAFKKSGKWTKRSVKKIKLEPWSWGTTHRNSYSALQEMLWEQMKLSFPKAYWTSCVFTDASNAFWSGLVTQRPRGAGKETSIAETRTLGIHWLKIQGIRAMLIHIWKRGIRKFFHNSSIRLSLLCQQSSLCSYLSLQPALRLQPKVTRTKSKRSCNEKSAEMGTLLI